MPLSTEMYLVFMVFAPAVLLANVEKQNIASTVKLPQEASQSYSYEVNVRADEPIHVTDERFLSLAVGVGTLNRHWANFSFSSSKLQAMTRALSPAYLRLGGTFADFLTFKIPCERKASLDIGEKYKETYLCPKDWDGINRFCVDTGLSLIFGLNLLLRSKDDRWNPSNAETLLDYNIYDVAWELGNEPNSYREKANISLSGSQIAADFNLFRSILQSRPRYVGASVYGPDVSDVGGERTTTLLTGFLSSTNATNATTFHSYYLDGRTATVDDFLDPETLDGVLPGQIDLVKSLVTKFHGKGARVWLGESGSAFGGGAPNISDRYVAGFLFLDKLGMSAKMGLDVVIRQAYYGAHYTMLNLGNLDPKPDYWIAYIYKNLVGQRVLYAEIKPVQTSKENNSEGRDEKYVRVYAHCTALNQSGYDAGAVTLIILNMHKKHSANITLLHKLEGSIVHQYLLTPHGPDGVTTLQVSLNGRLLQLKNDTILPDLEPVRIKRGDPVLLPPLSYGFYVVVKAKAKACIG